MDCTRPDHMGLYGYGRDTTPVIDRLADSGLTFDNAISAAVWTLESVASLYTGLFPTQHGVNIEHPLLSPRATTLASILQELGYETVAFTPGSWHGRNFGFNQGFDHFKETYRRFTHLDQLFRSETLPEKAWRHLGFRFDKNARAMNQAAMNWLSRRSSEKPFFLLIHYIEPHLPYHIPEPFRKMFLSNDITSGRGQTSKPRCL